MTGSPISDIAHTIQLAIAPVFLLTALGTFLAVLSTRLARITDRTRVLENLASAQPGVHAEELALLRRRKKRVNLAITFGTTAALFVCVSIATAFIGTLIEADVSKIIAAFFICAMMGFTGLLLSFLSEIRLAVLV
jgi:hypothetical protein